jgi:thiosulfate/3-mercaptopyruvate sulfurtransferase
MSLKSLCLVACVTFGWSSAAAEVHGEASAKDEPKRNETVAPEAYPRAALLVETETLAAWLAGQKSAPAKTDAPRPLAVIDARDATAHAAGHLPGAYFLEADLFQDPTQPDYLPTSAAVARVTGDFGIDPETRVVIYDAQGGRAAARLWFTLTAYGHRRVSLLNGGLPKWLAEKRPTETVAPQRPERPGTFRPTAQASGVCRAEDIAHFRAAAETPRGALPASSLLDARSWEEFRGLEKRGDHGGHIPGAVLFEWKSALRCAENDEGGVWRSPGELRALLHAAGISPDVPTAVYDQAGGRSAHLIFTLQLMGFTRVYNYVGGWRDYVKREPTE